MNACFTVEVLSSVSAAEREAGKRLLKANLMTKGDADNTLKADLTSAVGSLALESIRGKWLMAVTDNMFIFQHHNSKQQYKSNVTLLWQLPWQHSYLIKWLFCSFHVRPPMFVWVYVQIIFTTVLFQHILIPNASPLWRMFTIPHCHVPKNEVRLCRRQIRMRDCTN